MSRPAVFLDRDGVLVEEVYYPETGEIEAPLRPEDVRLCRARHGDEHAGAGRNVLLSN